MPLDGEGMKLQHVSTLYRFVSYSRSSTSFNGGNLFYMPVPGAWFTIRDGVRMGLPLSFQHVSAIKYWARSVVDCRTPSRDDTLRWKTLTVASRLPTPLRPMRRRCCPSPLRTRSTRAIWNLPNVKRFGCNGVNLDVNLNPQM